MSFMTVIVVILQIGSFMAASLLAAANVWICVETIPAVANLSEAMTVALRIYNVLLSGFIILSVFDVSFIRALN